MLKYIRSGTDSLREVFFYFVVILLISSYAFSYFEGVPFFDSFYWANVTATSTGYGDISPKTVGGKWVCILTMWAMLFVIAPMIIYRMIEFLSPPQHVFTEEEQEESIARENETLELLRELKAWKDGLTEGMGLAMQDKGNQP